MNLRQQAIKGVLWTGTGSALSTLIHLAQWAVLARLLAPDEFGLMAMCLVVIGLADAFTDLGVSSAIIHRRDTSRRQLSSLYWLNVACGIIVFLLVSSISPFVAEFYGEPQVAQLLSFAALSFLIAPFGQQFRVLLQKELRFRILARIDLWSAVAGAITAIGVALLGFGVLALVLGSLMHTAVRTVLLVLTGWRRWKPHLFFRSGDLQGYLSFGVFQVGERCVNAFAANVDYLIIGRLLGIEALGFYMIAYQLVIVPLMRINPVLTRVAFPVFSLRQDDDAALRRGYGEVGRLLAFVLCPGLVGLVVIAPMAVPIVFGEAWLPSVPLVQMLCLVGLLKAMINPAGSVLLAKGRPDLGFAWNVFVAGLNTAGFYLAAQFSVNAVAGTFMALMCIYYVLFHMLVLRSVIGLRFGAYLGSLGKPFGLALAMGVVVGVVGALAETVSLAPTLELTVVITIGAAVYVVEWLLLDLEYLLELTRLIGWRRSEA